jgi:hypothetical protein
MSTTKIICQICDTEFECGSYSKVASCPSCGQQYGYDEEIVIQLQPKQIDLLRNALKSGVSLQNGGVQPPQATNGGICESCKNQTCEGFVATGPHCKIKYTVYECDDYTEAQ